MKLLQFYGGSHDLMECQGAINEAINCYDCPGIFHLKSSEGQVQVVGIYMDNGCWAVGLTPIEEGVPIPDWPVRISQHENGYSPLLILQVPDDTILVSEDD